MKELKTLLHQLRQMPYFDREKAVKSILRTIREFSDDAITYRMEKIEREGPVCPHCNSNRFRRCGKQQQKQVFKCNECGRYYRITTNTFLYHLKKPELLPEYARLMLEGKSLRQCAQAVGISLQTSFEWRHKILTAIHQYFKHKKLSGIVEGWNFFVKYSNKGVSNARLWQRKKHIIEKKNQKNRGVVGIVCATDRTNNTWYGVAALNPINTNFLRETFADVIDKSSIFCAEKDRFFRTFCTKHHITYRPIFSVDNSVLKGIYHLHNVTQKFSDLELFLNLRYRGVSTKYLTNYLQLYVFTLRWHEYISPVHKLIAYAAEADGAWLKYKKNEKLII